mmetsp:Transcript_114610/g.370318  ORF Transcript_114610/g.370318 Transcript_114610/m.370318 type:complete len:212 (-) Transcript_114610:125-760(-)
MRSRRLASPETVCWTLPSKTSRRVPKSASPRAWRASATARSHAEKQRSASTNSTSPRKAAIAPVAFTRASEVHKTSRGGPALTLAGPGSANTDRHAPRVSRCTARPSMMLRSRVSCTSGPPQEDGSKSFARHRTPKSAAPRLTQCASPRRIASAVWRRRRCTSLLQRKKHTTHIASSPTRQAWSAATGSARRRWAKRAREASMHRTCLWFS